jgi:hypothetical protein
MYCRIYLRISREILSYISAFESAKLNGLITYTVLHHRQNWLCFIGNRSQLELKLISVVD